MQKNKPTGGRRSFGKVSKRMAEMSVIKITCGLVKGQLHKNKFYCPGIHRECIEYNGSFITPKMFSVMGDKEKLKDWKNAIRINGIQVRKYIESGTLDFYRHDEFCTGRCIARSPLNRSMQANAAAADLKVEFVSSINEHTYCHLRDDSETGLQLPTVEMTSDPIPVDVKPNVALLQSLLEKPLTSVDGVPPDVAAALANQKYMAEEEEPIDCGTESAEEDRQFWIGIMELGLLEHFFREIKITLDSFKSDLVTYHVRPKDAVRISNTVRNLGLMKRFKCRLSSFKSDMDLQQAKIDAEMTALKQKVTQYELRKEALKRKSEKFELLMDISSEKKFIIEKNNDISDGEEQADVDDDDDDNNDEDDDSDMEGVSVYMQENEDDEEEEGEDEEDTRDGFEVTEAEVCEKRVSVPTVVHVVPKTSQPPAAATSRDTAVPQPRASVTTAVARPAILGSAKKNTKAVAIPKSTTFNITTLPADSSSNYIIKNTSQTSHTPADQSKKVTIVRQVLMETANDRNPMERIKEAAANSLKEISGSGPNNTTAVAAGTAPDPSKSVAAPPKEKIRIIARYRSSVDSASPIIKKPTVPHPQDATPVTPTTTSAMLTYNAATNSLCTVSHPAESSTQKSSTDNTEKIKTSSLPMVVVTDIKKRKMGPRCKTMFSVDLGGIGKMADQDPAKVTFDSGCQTPIDGIRENPLSEEEKDRDTNTAASGSRAKPAVGARRSSRKTAHMFSWGMKEGADDSQKASECQDNTQLLTPEDLLNFSYQESPSLENV